MAMSGCETKGLAARRLEALGYDDPDGERAHLAMLEFEYWGGEDAYDMDLAICRLDRNGWKRS